MTAVYESTIYCDRPKEVLAEIKLGRDIEGFRTRRGFPHYLKMFCISSSHQIIAWGRNRKKSL